MSRNLYALAASLLLFSLISCGISMMPNAAHSGIAGSGALWKTIGLFLFLGALISAFGGVMTAMFEQVERRTEEQARKQARGKSSSGQSPHRRNDPPA